jgi:hypothetical protein
MAGMKLRHAAALALVGWYHRCSVGILPIHETPRPDLNAPLESWLVADVFDTAAQCKAALADVREMSRNPDIRKLTAKQLAEIQESKKELGASSDRCVASEDVRLKGKKLTIIRPSN